MTGFGLELRKIGDFDSLYKEVDLVLGKATKLAVYQQTVAHMIHKMMKPEQYVDVCNIKRCASMCHIIIPSERMQVYETCHCMHWSDMMPEYRQMVTAMILDDFRGVLTYKE